MGKIKAYENPLLKEITGETIRPGGFSITKRAIDLCSFYGDERILDIGCGRGATVEFLSKEYNFTCCGIDISEALISEGQKRNPSLNLNNCDAKKLPFANESFDAVFAECSFSLMQDKSHVLKEINRVLKNDGKLIISDMYLKQQKEPCTTKCTSEETAIDSCVLSAFNMIELEALLNKENFDIILFEDHTKELKELMANIILEYGELDKFWESVLGQRGCCASSSVNKNIGYFLIIAKKFIKGS